MYADGYLSFCYEWNVKYEDLLAKKFNDAINSSSFFTSHNGVFHEWKLRLKPAGSAGRREKTEDYFGIYVGLVGSDKHKTIKIKLPPGCFYERDGIAHLFEESGDEDVHNVNSDETFWGFRKAIKLEQKDGKYVPPFTCKNVKFYWKFGVDENAFNIDNSLPKPLKPAQNPTVQVLYVNTKEDPRSPTVDTTLVSNDGVKLHAHKCFLAAFSEVFKGMFFSDLNQDQKAKEILIDDIEGVGLQELLHFAYFGSPSSDIRDNVEPTLKAAHKYLVKGLVDECERVMVEKMYTNAKDFCVHYFCIAKVYTLKILEERSTAVLLDNWCELSASTDEQLKPYLGELADKLAGLVRCSKVAPE